MKKQTKSKSKLNILMKNQTKKRAKKRKKQTKKIEKQNKQTNKQTKKRMKLLFFASCTIWQWRPWLYRAGLLGWNDWY